MSLYSRAKSYVSSKFSKKKTTTSTTTNTGSSVGSNVPSSLGGTQSSSSPWSSSGSSSTSSGGSGSSSSNSGGSYQGPTQIGTNVETFRSTGISTPQSSTSSTLQAGSSNSGGSYQGPTQIGTNVETFRSTGKSVPIQGSGPQPNTISPAGSSLQQAGFLGSQTYMNTQRFDLNLLKKAGRQTFGTGEFQGFNPLGAIGTLASPFSSNKRVGEGEYTQGATFGSTQTGTPIAGSGAPVKTSKFDILTTQMIVNPNLIMPTDALADKIGSDFSKEQEKELQAEINTGNITVEEAQVKYEDSFKLKEGDFQKQLDQSLGFKSRVASSTQPAFNAPAFAETTGMLALSTTGIGGAIVGANFVSSGTPKVIGAPTTTGKLIGVGEIGLGLVGGGIGVKFAERSADRLLVQELIGQRGKLVGKELIKTPEGSTFLTSTTRGFGSEASLRTDIISPVFKTGKNTFSITGGKGITNMNYFSTEYGKTISSSEKFIFGFKGKVSPNSAKLIPRMAKGTEFQLSVPLKDTKGITGRGYIIKSSDRDSLIPFRSGGTSKEIYSGKNIFSKVSGGSLTKIKSKIQLFENPLPVTVTSDIKEVGYIKRLTSRQKSPIVYETIKPVNTPKIKLLDSSKSKSIQEIFETIKPLNIQKIKLGDYSKTKSPKTSGQNTKQMQILKTPLKKENVMLPPGLTSSIENKLVTIPKKGWRTATSLVSTQISYKQLSKVNKNALIPQSVTVLKNISLLKPATTQSYQPSQLTKTLPKFTSGFAFAPGAVGAGAAGIGGGFIGGFALPKLSLGLKTPAKGKRVSGEGIFGESTSFAGLTLGIKGTKKTVIAGKEVLTGMEVRGLSKKGKVIFKTKRKKKQIKRKKK